MCLSCTTTGIFTVKYRRDLVIWVRGHSRSLKMVPFEKFGTVSYSHSIATMAVSLAVSTQYTNVTDRQTPQDGIDSIGRAYAQHRAAKSPRRPIDRYNCGSSRAAAPYCGLEFIHRLNFLRNANNASNTSSKSGTEIKL